MTTTIVDLALADLLVELWRWQRHPTDERAVRRLQTKAQVAALEAGFKIRSPESGEPWIEDPTAEIISQPSDPGAALVVREVLRPGIYTVDSCLRSLQVTLDIEKE